MASFLNYPGFLVRRLATYILERFIGKYIDDEKKLDLRRGNFSKEKIELNDLYLNCALLNELLGSSPLRLTVCKIGQLSIGTKGLVNMSKVQAHISNIDIVLMPLANTQNSQSMSQQLTNPYDNSQTSSSTKSKQQASKNLDKDQITEEFKIVNSLLTKMLTNLEVSITNIAVRIITDQVADPEQLDTQNCNTLMLRIKKIDFMKQTNNENQKKNTQPVIYSDQQALLDGKTLVISEISMHLLKSNWVDSTEFLDENVYNARLSQLQFPYQYPLENHPDTIMLIKDPKVSIDYKCSDTKQLMQVQPSIGNIEFMLSMQQVAHLIEFINLLQVIQLFNAPKQASDTQESIEIADEQKQVQRKQKQASNTSVRSAPTTQNYTKKELKPTKAQQIDKLRSLFDSQNITSEFLNDLQHDDSQEQETQDLKSSIFHLNNKQGTNQADQLIDKQQDMGLSQIMDMSLTVSAFENISSPSFEQSISVNASVQLISLVIILDSKKHLNREEQYDRIFRCMTRQGVLHKHAIKASFYEAIISGINFSMKKINTVSTQSKQTINTSMQLGMHLNSIKLNRNDLVQNREDLKVNKIPSQQPNKDPDQLQLQNQQSNLLDDSALYQSVNNFDASQSSDMQNSELFRTASEFGKMDQTSLSNNSMNRQSSFQQSINASIHGQQQYDLIQLTQIYDAAKDNHHYCQSKIIEIADIVNRQVQLQVNVTQKNKKSALNCKAVLGKMYLNVQFNDIVFLLNLVRILNVFKNQDNNKKKQQEEEKKDKENKKINKSSPPKIELIIEAIEGELNLQAPPNGIYLIKTFANTPAERHLLIQNQLQYTCNCNKSDKQIDKQFPIRFIVGKIQIQRVDEWFVFVDFMELLAVINQHKQILLLYLAGIQACTQKNISGQGNNLSSNGEANNELSVIQEEPIQVYDEESKCDQMSCLSEAKDLVSIDYQKTNQVIKIFVNSLHVTIDQSDIKDLINVGVNWEHNLKLISVLNDITNIVQYHSKDQEQKTKPRTPSNPISLNVIVDDIQLRVNTTNNKQLCKLRTNVLKLDLYLQQKEKSLDISCSLELHKIVVLDFFQGKYPYYMKNVEQVGSGLQVSSMDQFASNPKENKVNYDDPWHIEMQKSQMFTIIYPCSLEAVSYKLKPCLSCNIQCSLDQSVKFEQRISVEYMQQLINKFASQHYQNDWAFCLQLNEEFEQLKKTKMLLSLNIVLNNLVLRPTLKTITLINQFKSIQQHASECVDQTDRVSPQTAQIVLGFPIKPIIDFQLNNISIDYIPIIQKSQIETIFKSQLGEKYRCKRFDPDSQLQTSIRCVLNIGHLMLRQEDKQESKEKMTSLLVKDLSMNVIDNFLDCSEQNNPQLLLSEYSLIGSSYGGSSSSNALVTTGGASYLISVLGFIQVISIEQFNLDIQTKGEGDSAVVKTDINLKQVNVNCASDSLRTTVNVFQCLQIQIDQLMKTISKDNEAKVNEQLKKSVRLVRDDSLKELKEQVDLLESSMNGNQELDEESKTQDQNDTEDQQEDLSKSIFDYVALNHSDYSQQQKSQPDPDNKDQYLGKFAMFQGTTDYLGCDPSKINLQQYMDQNYFGNNSCDNREMLKQRRMKAHGVFGSLSKLPMKKQLQVQVNCFKVTLHSGRDFDFVIGQQTANNNQRIKHLNNSLVQSQSKSITSSQHINQKPTNNKQPSSNNNKVNLADKIQQDYMNDYQSLQQSMRQTNAVPNRPRITSRSNQMLQLIVDDLAFTQRAFGTNNNSKIKEIISNALSIGDIQVRQLIANSKVPHNLIECAYCKRHNNFLEFVKIDELWANQANKQEVSIMVTLRPTKLIMSYELLMFSANFIQTLTDSNKKEQVKQKTEMESKDQKVQKQVEMAHNKYNTKKPKQDKNQMVSYLKQLSIQSTSISLDYTSNKMSFNQLAKGDKMQLLNMFNLNDLKISIKPFKLSGSAGGKQLTLQEGLQQMAMYYKQDLQNNQKLNILEAISPLKKLSHGTMSIVGLITKPIYGYQQGSLLAGLNEGFTDFYAFFSEESYEWTIYFIKAAKGSKQ